MQKCLDIPWWQRGLFVLLPIKFTIYLNTWKEETKLQKLCSNYVLIYQEMQYNAVQYALRVNSRRITKKRRILYVIHGEILTRFTTRAKPWLLNTVIRYNTWLHLTYFTSYLFDTMEGGIRNIYICAVFNNKWRIRNKTLIIPLRINKPFCKDTCTRSIFYSQVPIYIFFFCFFK